MNLPDFQDVTAASKQVATYSAMNPILWKTVICSPVGIICSAIAPSPINYFILALSSIPILVGSWGFVHFAKTNADRLQSEGHIEQMRVLSRIGDNENSTTISVSANNPRGGNPALEDKSDVG